MYETLDPVSDLDSLMEYLYSNQEKLGIDTTRISFWTCSGNAPVAVRFLRLSRYPIRSAVFYYSYLPSLNNKYHNEILTVSDEYGLQYDKDWQSQPLPDLTSILLVKAGRDQWPGINDTMHEFFLEASAQNLDVQFINYPEGVHGFDTKKPSKEAVEIVKTTIDFIIKRTIKTQ